METEKETEQRELEGWREWLILLSRVHISSPPLSLFLELRLSAPGSHTRGASHPIITLKWLLPHQWRTGRLARQWSSACFTVLVTFPKLSFQLHCVCVCVCVNGDSICQIVVTFSVSGSSAALLARTLHHSLIVGLWKMPDCEYGRMYDEINEVMQHFKETYACQKTLWLDWSGNAQHWFSGNEYSQVPWCHAAI